MKVLLAAPLLVVALACGAQDEPASGTPTNAATGMKVDLRTTDATFAYVAANEEIKPRALRELYQVFFRPPAARDILAERWAKEESRSAGERPTILPRIAEQARVLLADAGLDGEELVAAPVSEDMVCFALLSGGESCGPGFRHGVAIAGQRRAGRIVLFGLVGDEVKELEIIAGGRAYGARIGENGFACALGEVRQQDIEGARAHLVGGRVETFELR
jgi:hypothetical protein